MAKLRFRIAMSLDGFTAGPGQSVEHPVGVGGMRLFEWIFPLAVWRRTAGQEGGVDDASSRLLGEWRATGGATIMGRNMFGGGPGAWRSDEPWTGWWGAEPPFGHPVFVLTHHAREPLVMGATTFHFVTDGCEAALERAAAAARGRDVLLGGGANAAQQYLRAGLVDELTLDVVPALLGAGERLFEGLDDLHGLALARTVAMPSVVHMVFERR